MDNLFLCEYLGAPPKSSRIIDFVDRFLRKFVPWIRIGSFWRGNMASIESRMNIFYLLNNILENQIEGSIVEIGCNAGETTVILQRIIKDVDPNRALHAFDSFQGLPKVSMADNNVYAPGDMNASKSLFLQNFSKLGLDLPNVHEGWFEDSLPDGLPDRIAFALIDGDLYNSTLFALEQTYPRLSPGAICLLGVYWGPEIKIAMTTDMRYKSPGVKKACDEFLHNKPEKINVVIAGNYTSAYFKKV